MHENVKKYADSNDVMGLRYIFVDCLDVDPTFEKYAEDFAYCKDKEGLFETHRELTPMTMNQQAWDDDYWVQLKTDLMKNFSRERFGHMMQAAKVVYAEKLARITAEREQQRRQEEIRRQSIPESRSDAAFEQEENDVQISRSEEQQKMLAERRRQLDRERQQSLEKEQREKEQQKKRRIEGAGNAASPMGNADSGNIDSKKVLGAVLAAAIILIIILIIRGM